MLISRTLRIVFSNKTWFPTRPLIISKSRSLAALTQARIATPNSLSLVEPHFTHHDHTYNTSHIGILLTTALVLCVSDNKRMDRELLVAARDGKSSLVKTLLDSGANPNSRHPLGWTSLHTAVINGHLDTVKLLLKRGADVNTGDEFSTARRVAYVHRLGRQAVTTTRDREFCSFINHEANFSGFTPLHYAILTDNQAIIEALLESGADPSQENNRGLQPSHYCENNTILSLLETYVAKNKEAKLSRALEERRAFPLEDRLRAAIVGQEGPITATAAAIRRKENGWGDDDHPLVFLFLGSSGIGKTELAKQVAKYMFKDKKESFIRLDMSEYQEKHEVAKLIGAPPGYIGHDQGGQLTSQLSKCPNAVVLFDEVDKAHPDVLTVLLQLFDEGRLTDGQGKTIACKDAIFVMTSNLASDEIADHALRLRKEAARAADNYHHQESIEHEDQIEISREFKEQVVQPILKHHFKRDEFLGRITEMVYFLPFSRSELHQLVERELKLWQTRALERHSIVLTWGKEVLDVLADGYNVKYGARSIQHEVEKSVVNKLAAAYEEGVVKKKAHVNLIVEESVIKVQVQKTK